MGVSDSKTMAPLAFEVHGVPVTVELDRERTEESARFAREAVPGPESDPDFPGFEYWAVTWGGERAGHVYHVPGRAKHDMERGVWSYSDRVGNTWGGFIDAEEAARKLAAKYAHFRYTGWVYRDGHGWTGWRTHQAMRWFVTGSDHKRVMTMSSSERDQLIAQWGTPPRVEEFEVSVTCEADKAPGAGPCAHCEYETTAG